MQHQRGGRPVAGRQDLRQPAPPGLHHRQVPDDLRLQRPRHLFRVLQRVVEHVAHHRRSHGQQGREQEGQRQVQFQVREHRLEGRPGRIRDPDGAVLETGVDARFLDLSHQFLVQLLVALGLLFQRLVLEGARIEPVELRLGLGDRLLQHLLALGRLLEFDLHPVADVGPRHLHGSLHFGHLRRGLAVLRMVRPVTLLDVGEAALRLLQPLVELGERFALSGYLQGFQRPAAHRAVGGLLAHPVGLRVGELGVELQQARRQNAGLLLRVDHVQLALELHQRRARPLHLGLQLVQLLLHERSQAGRGAIADVVGVLQVGLRHAVGHVGRQARIRRAVADQQQIGVGGAHHLQLLEQHRGVLGVRRFDRSRRVRPLGFQQPVTLRHRPQHRIRLDQLDLRRQELIRIVAGRLRGLLAQHSGGHPAVDVDGRRGLEIRSDPRGDDEGGQHRGAYEREDLPAVALEDPQILAQRDGPAFRRRLARQIGDTEVFGRRRRMRGRRGPNAFEKLLFGHD